MTAAMVVDTLSNFAAALVDQRAAMTETEKKAMREPLARTLSRFTPAIASALQKYADPVALVIAFGLWGNRIRELRQEASSEPSRFSAPPPADLAQEPKPAEAGTPSPAPIKVDLDITGATPAPAELEYMRSPI